MKEGWNEIKLEDVATCQIGLTYKPTDVVDEGGTIVLRSSNIQDSKIALNDLVRVNCDITPSKYVKDGDILMCSRNGSFRLVGKVAKINKLAESMSFGAFMTIIRSKYNDFLFYFFQSQSFRKQIFVGQTATINQITTKMLNNTHVNIPPLSEQQHIVEELELLSSILEKKKAQLNELDNLAQSLFYEMFGDPINNEKGWKEKRLDEVCDVRDGTHDSPKYVIESDYVLITSKNIQDGELSFNNVNYITKEDYDKINVRSYVDDGDIIMAMIGTIGKPIIIKKCGKKFGIKNVALLKFRESHDVINVYVKSMLDNPTYMKYLHSLNRGGTQKFLSLKTIRNLPILLPPLYLQNQFASKIEAIEHQKELIKQSIKEVETLFNSRMDYYFN